MWRSGVGSNMVWVEVSPAVPQWSHVIAGLSSSVEDAVAQANRGTRQFSTVGDYWKSTTGFRSYYYHT